MTRTRWLILVLLVSLAANVFVGGLAIGRWADHGWQGGQHMRSWHADVPDGPGPRWLRRMVGEEGLPVLGEVWQRHEAAIDPLREQSRAARNAVTEALGAEPFDREAYAAALDAMRHSMEAMHEATHTAMIDLVDSMTAEQRAAFAERARAWSERRRERQSRE